MDVLDEAERVRLDGGVTGCVDPRGGQAGVDSVVFAEQVARSPRRWRSPPSVAR
ncbi:hypothetical protein I553_2289 [Mycobacterium xenopi 4042]|uniref:Uncharacterized protein n=1 Tax=Mycobacterium xenopi 4042 TaxID=1299334 RepID=X7ZCD8_MYCXE|nr:hypothetical protein I553_2289 [Mycobacterium xenopi 4042]